MLFHVNQINAKLLNQPYVSLKEMKERVSASASGFYWIYSDLSIDDFKKSSSPLNAVHVHIKDLANMHDCLEHVIKPSNPDFWCIYNGKGKQLKSRIAAEFTNTSGATGKLALKRCFKEEKFKIKYVICGDQDSPIEISTQYSKLEKHLERAWRLHHGWPMLCRV